jgi:RHS repeat-associated protein
MPALAEAEPRASSPPPLAAIPSPVSARWPRAGYRNKAFTGREWNPEIGPYYYRARYYDPEAGRFVSEDPLRLVAGPNLYAHAAQDPVGFADPRGLDTPRCDLERSCVHDALLALQRGRRDDDHDPVHCASFQARSWRAPCLDGKTGRPLPNCPAPGPVYRKPMVAANAAGRAAAEKGAGLFCQLERQVLNLYGVGGLGV